MLEPLAYLSHMPTLINAKFGIHGTSFATLGDYLDFHKATHLYNGFENLIQIDLSDALDFMRLDPQAELVISVPLLGFTDPAFDYDIRPWFATPFSLNGFGASKHDPLASKAKRIHVQDILNNEYDLIFNDEGMIDYAHMSALYAQKKLFTTLKRIDFIYTAEQVLRGLHLTPLPFLEKHVNKMLMLPPLHIREPFEIGLKVQHDDKSLYQQSVLYQAHKNDPLFQLNGLEVHWEGDKNKGMLHIEVDAQATEHWMPEQIALQANIHHCGHWQWDKNALPQEIDLINAQQNQMLLLQYQGLSKSTIKKVLTCFLSKDKFYAAFDVFEQNHHEQVFNDFTQASFEQFYETLIEDLGNNSLPLLALEAYFTDETGLDKLFEYLGSLDLSGPDKAVLKRLSQVIEDQPEDKVYAFADKLDQLLVLDRFHPQWHLKIPTQGPVDISALDIFFVMESLNPEHNHKKQYFGSLPAKKENGGHRSFSCPIKDAQVIEKAYKPIEQYLRKQA